MGAERLIEAFLQSAAFRSWMPMGAALSEQHPVFGFPGREEPGQRTAGTALLLFPVGRGREAFHRPPPSPMGEGIQGNGARLSRSAAAAFFRAGSLPSRWSPPRRRLKDASGTPT